MATDQIGYEQLLQSALRSVVREALLKVQNKGLLPPHHFYVSFKTDHPGVSLPDSVREQYPEEMTIVLQHQFWDLKVEPGHFSVMLSFKKVPAHIVIPYEALTAFVDPGINFGLQFQTRASGGDAMRRIDVDAAGPELSPSGSTGQTDAARDSNVVTLDTFRRR